MCKCVVSKGGTDTLNEQMMISKEFAIWLRDAMSMKQMNSRRRGLRVCE